MDTPRAPRQTLNLPEGAPRPRTQFSEKPGYKPGYRPQGGPRKRPETSDPDLIRDWPRVPEANGERLTLSVRRDSIGWVTPLKADPKNKCVIGLRNAGAAPIPIDAPYALVNDWWRGAYPLTVKRA